MTRTTWFVLLLLCTTATATANTLHPGQDNAACAVWQRELSFAQSVQRHDVLAFAAHVAPAAVFDANTGTPTRGREAVRRQWAPIIAGKSLRLNWYPRHVVVSGNLDLAFSSGPYLLQIRAPATSPRFMVGTFGTVWRRGGDGAWRVVFDSGDAGRPASAADIATFQAGRQTQCPKSGNA